MDVERTVSKMDSNEGAHCRIKHKKKGKASGRMGGKAPKRIIDLSGLWKRRAKERKKNSPITKLLNTENRTKPEQSQLRKVSHAIGSIIKKSWTHGKGYKIELSPFNVAR